MKRKIILRDYQIPAIDYIMNNNKCVLAITPNGGKTEISIVAIDNYLKLNPNHKVLILTHSTNVLLDNFYDRLKSVKVGFKYSKNFDEKCNVHLCLPSNEKYINDNYDFVIIDEAHENYFAPREQRIIKNINPDKLLLLTGTPSKFIAEGGYKIYPIAANEISDKWFSKLNIELLASNYNWIKSYNKDNEVKNTYDFNINDTEETLALIFQKIIQRLKIKLSSKHFNHPNFIEKIQNWYYAYNQLGKTIIYCKTINQANDVTKILKQKNVKVISSHFQNDENSENIIKFKNNEYDVLVVINRGRLGYSDDDLMNIIDISGTHNPDVIFQMFCRALRGNPSMEKFYLKLTSKELHHMALTHISVCVALMLTDKEYLLKYNGKNLNSFKIPILKKEKKDNDKLKRTYKNKKNTDEVNLPAFSIDSIDTMRDVLHDLNNPISIYKETTIDYVKQQLGYKRKVYTIDYLLESARGNVKKM